MTTSNPIVKAIVVQKRKPISADVVVPNAEVKNEAELKKPHYTKRKTAKPGQNKNKKKIKGKTLNRAENIIYTDEALHAMTREELNKLALEQSDEIARITNQLVQAKVLQKNTGAKVDQKWMGQATCAKRMKTNLISRIYMVINKVKKEQKQLKAESFERLFMTMAKDMLSDSQYEEIMNATRVETVLKAA